MNAVDAAELSAGEVEGRRQIVEYFRFLREQVPGFADSRIVEIAPQVGIRETRRIEGRYALTGDDILNSARFDDTIGINAWPMELHRAGGISWGFPVGPGPRLQRPAMADDRSEAGAEPARRRALRLHDA
jgi:hypothetical protein